jgi:type VI secretion system protein ImpL
MPDDEINQILGYTFSETSFNDEELEGLFSQEYDKLYDVLSNMRLANLSNPGDILKQSKIYNFPERFYSAKEKINLFISHLFQLNFYAENPILRGFYFTSSTQNQLSVNRASEEIEMQFNPETHVTRHRGAVINPRTYFIQQLFSGLIIAEKHLVKPTPRMKLRFNFKNILLGFITAVLLILFILNIIMSAARNRDDIIELKSMIYAVDQIDWEQKAEPAHFELLYQLQSFTTHLQDAPLLSGSIYQGERLIKPANEIFIKKFNPLISNYLYRDVLSKYLHSYLNKTAPVSRDQAYEYLRAYLLLDTEINRLADEEAEKQFLKSLMTTLVDSIFDKKFNIAYQSTFNEQRISSLHDLLQKEVTYFVDVLTYEDIENLNLPFRNDKRLVQRVRKALGKPDISDVYARIKREGMVKFKQTTINQLLSQYGEDYFENNALISEFFSKNAWQSYISDKINEASKNPNRDDWVLNVQASELPAEFQDATIMKQKLQQRYFYEYGKAWWRFLGNIRYVPFEDEMSASRQLSDLGDFIESPIRKLIDIVTDQTRFEGVIDQKAVELKKELGLSATRHSIDDQFRFVHALSEDEGGKLGDLLSQYESLSSVLEKVQEDAGENSAKLAADVIQQGSGDIPDAMQAIRRMLRRLDQGARISIFEKPVTMSWNVLLVKVQQYLSDQWTENVSRIFDSEIAHTYPINKKSNTEISPVDLARFFKKSDGTLWSFVDIELKPFLRKNSWNPDTWEGSGIILSQRLKSSLQKAHEVTEGLGLLTQDELKLDFKILPQLPVSKIGSVEQIILIIDGQELIYRMGRPTWENFFWPNPESVGSARIEVRTRISNYRPQQFDGSWSWFRLLDQAIIKTATAAEFNAEWRFPPDHNYEVQVKFKISAHTINNPFGQKSFFNISFPSSLNEQ